MKLFHSYFSQLYSFKFFTIFVKFLAIYVEQMEDDIKITSLLEICYVCLLTIFEKFANKKNF